jgi:midasin
LGGFKPVELRLLCLPIKNMFDKLFPRTFSKTANAQFLDQVNQAFATKNWKQFIRLLQNSVKMVEAKYLLRDTDAATDIDTDADSNDDKKSTSTRKAMKPELRARWHKLIQMLAHFDVQHTQLKNNFAFTFVEGALVKAVRNGYWVLLDEV